MTHKKTIILAISTIFVLAIVASLIFVIKHNSLDIKTKMIPAVKEIIIARLWMIIALVSAIVLSFSSILIYDSVAKHKKLPEKSSMIGILIGSSILTGFLIGGIYRAITYKSNVRDQVSSDRMDRINEVFNAQFGPKWIIVFAIFIFFLIIILYQLYRNNRNGVDVNLNDENAAVFKKYLLGLSIILTIGVVILVTMAIKKMRQDKKALKDNGDFYQTSETSKMTQVIGLGLVTLIIVGGVILIIVKQMKKPK